jgi:hypothetical protein
MKAEKGFCNEKVVKQGKSSILKLALITEGTTEKLSHL